MAGAAVRAWSLARGQPPVWRRRFVTAVGFTLIALFDGFAIVTALDAGVPGWAIAVVAVAVILAGRRAVQWAEHEAAPPPCACRKCHPCRLSGVPVLVGDAAEAVASADVKVGGGGHRLPNAR
jgi:hypothetical protein